MSHLNGKGPEDLGPKTGRKLGKCRKSTDELQSKYEFGQGMGKRRKAGVKETVNNH